MTIHKIKNLEYKMLCVDKRAQTKTKIGSAMKLKWTVKKSKNWKRIWDVNKETARKGKNLQESMATIIPICLSSVRSANLDSVFQIVSIFLSGILVQVIKIFCILKNSFLENSTWNSITSGEFWREKKFLEFYLLSPYTHALLGFQI